MTATLWPGLSRLPHFDPDRHGADLDPVVSELRAAIRGADALLLSIPEYAGAMPGAFKTLLEWCIGDDHPRSIAGKPVAWVNCSSSPTGAADAHASLEIVLRYAHAAPVREACLRVPVPRRLIGPDGLVGDAGVRERLAASLGALLAAS